MNNAQVNPVLRYIRKVTTSPTYRHLSDGQLLQRFAVQHDEGAFEALLSRHGELVLGVCVRVLRNQHDAEDAFQATFLVLACKAASVSKKESVACWLHGVARRLALKAKTDAARRQARDAKGAKTADAPLAKMTWEKIEPILNEELERMAAKHRAPLVLCYLEGKTRDEAAQQLGWSVRTLMRRLNEGRELLRGRLTRRGVSLAAALVTAGLSCGVASAGVPVTLMNSTIKAAASIAVGKAVGSGIVSTKVAALTEGMLKTMLLTKLKTLTAAIVVVLGCMIGGGALFHHETVAAQQANPKGDGAPEANAKRQKAVQAGKEQEPLIKPRDILVLRVTSIDDPEAKKRMEVEHIVRPDGTLSVDIYGAYYVSKMTTEQAGAAIESRLRGWNLMENIKVRVVIKGRSTDEIWRAVEDLEVAREKLREANKSAEAARKLFLEARARLETAKNKGQPVEAKIEKGVLVRFNAAGRKLGVEKWLSTHEPDYEILGAHQIGIQTRVYEDFAVAGDATILQDNIETKLADLKRGSHVTLQLDPKGKNVVRVAADGGTAQVRFVSANEVRNTIVVLAGKKDERKVYHLVSETEVVGANGKAVRASEIKEGTPVVLTRSVEDPNTVIRIETVPANKAKEE